MKFLFKIAFISIISLHSYAQDVKDSTNNHLDSVKLKIDSLLTHEEAKIEKKSRKERKKEAEAQEDSTLSYAEEYKKGKINTIFGLRGGMTLGNFQTTRSEVLQLQSSGLPFIPFLKDEILLNQQNVMSYMGGLFLRLNKGSFYWQPEVDYTVRGGKFDILQKTGSVRRIESTFTSIDIPMMFGLRFRKGRLFAGPVGTFQFQISENWLNTLRGYTPTPDEIKGNLFQRPSFGFQAGLGFDFNRLFIEGRYESALADYVNYDLGISSNPAKFIMRPQGFQFTVGFLSK